MELAVHAQTHGGDARGVELLDKTNRFNFNGQRVPTGDIDAAIEIWVMSCRAFRRHVSAPFSLSFRLASAPRGLLSDFSQESRLPTLSGWFNLSEFPQLRTSSCRGFLAIYSEVS